MEASIVLQNVDSYFIDIIAPRAFPLEFTREFAPGTNVHATISLSSINTSFTGLEPDPHFDVRARIASWVAHLRDGGEGPRIFAQSSSQNAVTVTNCARITFLLFGLRVVAKAQINIFTF
jgi:hypothetical protein